MFTEKELDFIYSLMLSYVIYYDQADLEEVNTEDLDKKIEDKNLSKKDLKKILRIVDEVDSESCNDPLYDRYMEEDARDWMFEKDFDLSEYLEDLIG